MKTFNENCSTNSLSKGQTCLSLRGFSLLSSVLLWHLIGMNWRGPNGERSPCKAASVILQKFHLFPWPSTSCRPFAAAVLFGGGQAGHDLLQPLPPSSCLSSSPPRTPPQPSLMTYVLFAGNVCRGQVVESKNANRSAFCNRASSLLKLVTR